MARKITILNQIQILVFNSFKTLEYAFYFFDNDQDGKRSKKKISDQLKSSEINGLIRSIVTNIDIDGYDKDGDGLSIRRNLGRRSMKLSNNHQMRKSCYTI